jgi:hypothetical protein
MVYVLLAPFLRLARTVLLTDRLAAGWAARMP